MSQFKVFTDVVSKLLEQHAQAELTMITEILQHPDRLQYHLPDKRTFLRTLVGHMISLSDLDLSDMEPEENKKLQVRCRFPTFSRWLSSR